MKPKQSMNANNLHIVVCEADLYILMLYVSQLVSQLVLGNPSEREKVGVFGKILLECYRIGTKHFKIGVKMA